MKIDVVNCKLVEDITKVMQLLSEAVKKQNNNNEKSKSKNKIKILILIM